MKIGILQTGYVPQPLVETHGDYSDMFAALLSGHGFVFETFPVKEMAFPDTVHACDGWLITGSADGAYENHAYIPVLENFIRDAFEADVPIAGICFGHQIMAQALGGKVIKYPKGWGVGFTRYHTPEGEAELLAMHQDQVIEKPESADVVASTDFCANAGLAYKGTNGVKALSFQPHPEFSTEFMADLIRFKRGQGLPEDQADAALERLRDAKDADPYGQKIAAFFLAARKSQSVNSDVTSAA